MSTDVLRREEVDEDVQIFLNSLTPQQLQRMFWESPWRMCESEEMARQTLSACKMNLAKHGDPFSWVGTSVRAITGGGLGNNPEGLKRIVDSGYFVIEDAPDGLHPPESILTKDGKPQILRITRKLVEYARAELLKAA